MEKKFGRQCSYWIKAARPRTLPASVSPVLIACAITYKEGFFQLFPAILCVLVALFAQIASNFANDYFDYKKGADGAERLGPERAVAQGWISPRAMLSGTFVALGIACLSGCVLLYFSDWRLIFVGLAIALCVLAYSAGPYPLAYNGWGDLCVLLFYGIIPVCFTYYVQVGSFSLLAFLLSLAVGLLSINILVVNNYRDYEQDCLSGKRTTIVLFGRRFGKILYLLNIILAFGLLIPLLFVVPVYVLALSAFVFTLCVARWLDLSRKEGKALNQTLGATAGNVLLFSLLVVWIVLVMPVA